MFYLFILFIILILATLTTMALASLSAAPYVPIPKRDVSRLLKLAQVKPADTVYDLGSGDARLLVAAARQFKVKKSVGLEISLLPYLISKIKILGLGLNSPIDIRFKNLYQEDLSPASVITCFLMPHSLKKLAPKFKKELAPKTRLVSYAFQIPGLNLIKKDKPNPKSTAIYLYEIELNSKQ